MYTVCNNLSTARNYHVSVWVDHLIADTGWKDKAAGFGAEMEQSFDLYSPFTNTAVNGGEDVLEQTVEKSFVSDTYKTQKLTFKHRSTLASMGKTQFPKILVIGDSVTDGYLAGVGKQMQTFRLITGRGCGICLNWTGKMRRRQKTNTAA